MLKNVKLNDILFVEITVWVKRHWGGKMEIIDNRNKTLLEDLKAEITSDSKLCITAACFSVFAFQELKAELGKIEELRFIFTDSPSISHRKLCGVSSFSSSLERGH